MQLQNIHNFKRKIFLFERLDSGDLVISEDEDFYPYFYQKDENGEYNTYDGFKARRVVVAEPADVPKQRNEDSYESDIIYTKRYILDNINKFDKCPLKYFVIDIEILCKGFPDIHEAKDPVSCITIYNSFNKKYKQWYLGDWGGSDDKLMLDDFISYIKEEKPDILVGWYINGFDYPYLFNRVPNLSNRLSPIGLSRRYQGKRSEDEDEKHYKVFYPAGISFVDMDAFYKRLYKGLKDYKLNTVLAHEFGKGKTHQNADFSRLTNQIKERNFEDVEGIVKLEEKKKILEHFDEIRRFARVEWEDLTMNSRGIDICLLTEAKNKKIVLPAKKRSEDDDEFEGAYREAFKTGIFHNLGKYDLSGAYLYTITDLCLDASNIVDTEIENSVKVKVTERETGKISSVYNIKQDSCTLLPTIVKDISDKKNTFKELKNKIRADDPDYEDISKKYNGIKEFALSYWGVIGNKGFRLYDQRIASMITSTVRDLLYYTRDELKKLGHEVVYIDTDSVFVSDEGKELTVLLNDLIQKWSKERFGKSSTILFDFEGRFKDIFIKAKCHYLGRLDTGNGVRDEKKGLEAKRSSATTYEGKFQEKLINMLLDAVKYEEIVSWIKKEIDGIRNIPITQLACPCKIRGAEYTKNIPGFVKAYENTKTLISNFSVEKGESFYYVYVTGLSKGLDMLAIKENTSLPSYVEYDWDRIIERNILSKVNGAFDACGWKFESSKQMTF